MKSEIQKLEGLTRRLNIEIPHDVVSAELERMYQQVQRVAKLKGFRPGKVPLTKVKTEYKHQVEQDVATNLIQDNYTKALNEHDTTPVSFPNIEFTGLKEGEPLKFSAVFEVRPNVEVKKYLGLDVDQEKLEVNKETIDGILEDIRKNKATLVPVLEDRAAQLGDTAVIDFKGVIEGKDLPNGAGEEYPLELGSQSFIPGFEEGIVGMKPGATKTISLQFPSDYNPKELASKKVDFTVTVKELKKKKLPELDDEFAKSIGSHESLAHFREEIEKDVKAREEKRVKDDLKNRILHRLVELNPFEVPRAMVNEQKEALIEDLHKRMEQQGMGQDQFAEYKTKWDKDFEKSSEFIVRSGLLINTIAKKDNLIATDEDFQKKLQEYADQTKIEIEKIKAFYGKPESKSRLLFQMTEEKVMSRLIDNAKISLVPANKLKKIED